MPDLTLEDLTAHYDAPRERTAAKALPCIDGYMAKFIGLSPFCVLATVGGDGTLDASPRGGAPGFVRVEGPNLLLMPDRPGNNRLDSWKNCSRAPARWRWCSSCRASTRPRGWPAAPA
jgi:predicted pyridoxine 5'-phosphate oxidase superfamily flavin-nucleotide-binding protein